MNGSQRGTEPARIILVDDHWLIRASLKSLVVEVSGFEVVAEASDGFEALDLIATHRPDIVLMDLSLPKLNGLEATRRIVEEFPDTKVIVLSMHSDESRILRALGAGASGYILKSSAPNELKLAFDSVLRGQLFLSPSISKHIVDIYLGRVSRQADPIEQLTARQREILQLIAEGHSSKRIAQMLGAGVKTIETHRANLMDRLDIHDVAGLVRFAIRHGIVSADK